MVLYLGFLFEFLYAQSFLELKKVAKNAYYEKSLLSNKKVKFNEINLINNKIIYLSEEKKDTAFVVWQVKDKGFIITSGDFNIKPILAYSFENSFSSEIPPTTNEMFKYYKKVISYAKKNNVKSDESIKMWEFYLNASASDIEKAVQNKSIKSVEPLLHTDWGQGKYYNASCPEDPDGEDGHVYVGCVALSTSMVMKYYNYPDVGQGSNTSYNYTNGGYGTFTIDFSSHEYHFENMPLDATRYNEYLADLLFHVGVAVNMHWGPDGSGTYTEFVPGALKQFFKYSSDVELVEKDDYTTQDWISLLQNQLDNKWPMVYSGQSDQGGGHAWNCDGYQDTYFHMNWGWDGAYNGFYSLDELTAGSYDFTYDFKAVINIYPESNYPSGCNDYVINGFEGSFDDGSGNQQYGEGWNCTYLLQPICGKYITLKFKEFDLGDGDLLVIYDGATTSSPVIDTLSNSNIPTIYDFYKNDNPEGMLIEFITDNASAGEGWLATYSVKNCATDTIYAESGTFSDGSGDCDYLGSTYCKWYIDTDNEALLLTFNEWDLPQSEPNDYLQIYNGLGTTDLITKLTGDSNVTSIFIPSGKATLRFMSDGDNIVGGGWTISYAPASFVNIEDMNGLSIAVYPNPISENSFVEVNSTKLIKNVSFVLYDNLGREVGYYYLDDIIGKVNVEFAKITKTDLSRGIYVLKIGNENFTKQVKIISYK